MSYHLAEVILEGENNLESNLLVVVSAIASNSHRRFDLHGTCGRVKFGWDLLPLFNLLRVENNDPLGLAPLPVFFLLRFLDLFAIGALVFTRDTARTDVDLPAVLWFIISLRFRLDINRVSRGRSTSERLFP